MWPACSIPRNQIYLSLQKVHFVMQLCTYQSVWSKGWYPSVYGTICLYPALKYNKVMRMRNRVLWPYLGIHLVKDALRSMCVIAACWQQVLLMKFKAAKYLICQKIFTYYVHNTVLMYAYKVFSREVHTGWNIQNGFFGCIQKIHHCSKSLLGQVPTTTL